MSGFLVLVSGWLALAAGVSEMAGAPAQEDRVRTLVAGSDRFGFALYGQLRSAPGNVFLSPASLTTAMAMAYVGARGETAAEMGRTLLLGLPREEVPAAFAAWRILLEGDGKTPRPYELAMANRLWGQRGYHFLPEFLAATREGFGAGLGEVNFAAESEARRTINAWVADQTRDRIRDLIPSGVLTPRTPLVLTNAIYFKGTWSEPFPAGSTQEEAFHVTSTREVRVSLMHRTGQMRYWEGDGLKGVELPYEGGSLAMVVLLPDTVDGLPALEARLSADTVTRWIDGMRSRRVAVSLPRFVMESQFSLAETLRALGMLRAFDERAADFSGITSQEELYIDAVLHKAYVDVNEKGTEAAAATAVVLAPRAALASQPAVFRADHPFVFLIRDIRTGGVIFLGRVIDPSR